MRLEEQGKLRNKMIDELFQLWDLNNSGDISKSELNALLKCVRETAGEEDPAKNVVDIADENGDGKMSRTELSQWLHRQEHVGGPKVDSFVANLLQTLKQLRGVPAAAPAAEGGS